ncbi:hypothetical protein BY458DRAFT_516870, partial [Sporodiniella umbellata]
MCLFLCRYLRACAYVCVCENICLLESIGQYMNQWGLERVDNQTILVVCICFLGNSTTVWAPTCLKVALMNQAITFGTSRAKGGFIDSSAGTRYKHRITALAHLLQIN